MKKSDNLIEVIGAKVHNLKNVDVVIPHNKLTVVTGLSGSGKSSLAFDTIYAEGQRRYMETFSAYARQFIGVMERPDVEKIIGLSPVIAIEQKTTNKIAFFFKKHIPFLLYLKFKSSSTYINNKNPKMFLHFWIF